jgi:hypothetical protein
MPVPIIFDEFFIALGKVSRPQVVFVAILLRRITFLSRQWWCWQVCFGDALALGCPAAWVKLQEAGSPSIRWDLTT